MKVLGISGKRGAGKDTLCNFLIGAQDVLFHGMHVERIGLADPIKELLIYGFGADRELCYGDDAQKETQLPNALTGVSIRDGAKLIGQAFAQLEPNHWVRCFETAVNARVHNTRETLIICTDVRFPKEVDAIRRLGGKTIRLERQISDDKHVSEMALDDYHEFDAIVPETYTIAQTQHLAVSWLNACGWIRRAS